MFQRKNFAYGKVATAPSPAASGTTLVLETGQGTRFPNTSGGTYVCVVKQTNLPATPDNAEVVLVTSHDPANDNFIITREQEGSSARTIEVGDEFYLSPTDGVWDQIDKLTTKGDLLGFDTAYARIPVGTDDYVLTADSTDDQGVAWKAIGAESKIIGEVPTGTVNGTNDDFELSEEPFSGTLQVYLNGVRQKITDDYTLSGTTITFVTPPLTGSSILCDFNQNVTPAGNADTLDGQHLSGIVPTLKATGAEINTGTEDAKIVTPKAIADSNVLVSSDNVALTSTAAELNLLHGKLGAGTSFTPAYTNLTVGTGTNVGKYLKIGRLVRFETFWNFSTGGAVSGVITLTLPVAISGTDNNIPIGKCYAIDATDGKTYVGEIRTNGALYFNTVSGSYIICSASSSTVPITFDSGDYLLISGVYESST